MRILGKILFPDLPPWKQMQYGRVTLVIFIIVALLSMSGWLFLRFHGPP